MEAALRHVYTNADARAGSAHARVALVSGLQTTPSGIYTNVVCILK